jgi:hypothetical protein
VSALRCCKTCTESKPLTDFYRSSWPGCYQNECKACMKVRNARNHRRQYHARPLFRLRMQQRNRRYKALQRSGLWTVEPAPALPQLPSGTACVCGHAKSDHLLDSICMQDCPCKLFKPAAKRLYVGGSRKVPLHESVVALVSATRPVSAPIFLDFDGIEFERFRQRLERRPSRALEVA